MIGIIDYQAGNLKSVKNALNKLEIPFKTITKQNDFFGVKKVIFPGVGAFGYAIETLKEKKLFFPIKNWIQKEKPFLGICLGFQLLFEESEESPGIRGLGIIKSKCFKFNKGKSPIIGWNKVTFNDENLKEFNRNFFYFIHGYYAPVTTNNCIATTNNIIEYCCAVKHKKALGIQFHPEKSGEIGLKFLKKWSEKC